MGFEPKEMQDLLGELGNNLLPSKSRGLGHSIVEGDELDSAHQMALEIWH